VFCTTLGVLALLVLAVQAWFYAHVVWWKYNEPAQSAFMKARLEELHKKDAKAVLRHHWVPYEKISPNLKRAVVAAEDAKFVGHEGFDWEAISKAIERNEKKGKVVSGASTISQQLAKNLSSRASAHG
jgi:monofunctional glycosyltransferase